MVFAVNPAATLPPVYGFPPRRDIAPVSAVPPLGGAARGQNARVPDMGISVEADLFRAQRNGPSFRDTLPPVRPDTTEDALRDQGGRPTNLLVAADPATGRVLIRAQAESSGLGVVLPPPVRSVANDADADGVLDTRDLAPNYAITGVPRVFGYGSVAALAPVAAPTGQMITLVA